MAKTKKAVEGEAPEAAVEVKKPKTKKKAQVWNRNIYIGYGQGVATVGTEATPAQLKAWPSDQGDVNKYLD